MAPSNILVCVAELLAFHLLRIIFSAIQRVKWILDGTHWQILEARKPENFGSCAQVLKVRHWHMFDYWVLYNGPSNLILSHDRFVHPNYIMKDEISLYCLTQDEAMFVEAPPGVEVWKKRYSAFHKIAQHQYAQNIIRMPLTAFYKLVKEMEELKAQLIFVEFFPRSGSTLMCQIFEETGVCVSYSEAHALNQIWGKDSHGKDPEDSQKRLEAAIRILCKPRSKPTSAFVFKIGHFTCNPVAPIVARSFPTAKFMYLYRDSYPNLLSVYKTMNTVNCMRLVNSLQFMSSMWVQLYRKMAEHANMDLGPHVSYIFDKSIFSVPLIIYLAWAQNVIAYLQEQKSGSHPKTPPIKYEDLVSNPLESTTAIIRYCGLPEELVPKAMKAFESDSQAGTILSRSEMICTDSLTGLMQAPGVKKNIAELCQVLGLPSPDQELRLPNTITSPGKRPTVAKLREGT